jgi:hypothetical protein
LSALTWEGREPDNRLRRQRAATRPPSSWASDSADGVGVLGGVTVARRRRLCRLGSGGENPVLRRGWRWHWSLEWCGRRHHLLHRPARRRRRTRTCTRTHRGGGARWKETGTAMRGLGRGGRSRHPCRSVRGIALFLTSSSYSSPPPAASSRSRRSRRQASSPGSFPPAAGMGWPWRYIADSLCGGILLFADGLFRAHCLWACHCQRVPGEWWVGFRQSPRHYVHHTSIVTTPRIILLLARKKKTVSHLNSAKTDVNWRRLP